MKKQLFFACTLFCLIGILACQQQPANVPANTNADIQPFDRINGEIDSIKAIAYINVWDSLRPSIKAALVKGGAPNYTNDVPRSFYVPIQDILSLAKNSSKTDQLFAVLAIEPDSLNNPQLTLIFRAPDDKGQRHYYDFSRPCPPCHFPKK